PSSAYNMKKALLKALLEPITALRQAEEKRDFTTRLALLEEEKSLPWQAVWNIYCERHNVPVGSRWLADIRRYENNVLNQR
ncbi:L-rhamnose isomerase, partial [Pasteurellaceae bacterium USgator11]